MTQAFIRAELARFEAMDVVLDRMMQVRATDPAWVILCRVWWHLQGEHLPAHQPSRWVHAS